MSELAECIDKKRCSSYKKNLFTHVRKSRAIWRIEIHAKELASGFENRAPAAVLQLHMLEILFAGTVCQEGGVNGSYLLVYRNDSVTEFVERFINYGFNKISYVETIRREEYRFALAGNVFAFDLPHLPYLIRRGDSWCRSAYNKDHTTHTKSGNYMINYYYTQKLLKRTKNNKHILPICKYNVWHKQSI